MATPSIWRSRPIFITSTFRDMHAERDWLRTWVFPEIEERLRARFHYLETIDLRWGVDSASAEQEHEREVAVLSVCLDEIRRSRPFLIGLLGDRYGWRPAPLQINGAAREAGLTGDVAGKSVTEVEILHGVLRSPDQQRRSWFYFRESLPYGEMPAPLAARYSDRHSGDPDAEEKAERLAALKATLEAALPGRVRTYSAHWDAARQSVAEADLRLWGARVLEDLWSDLESDTASFLRDAPQTWQDQDRWALEEFIDERVRGFVGRAAITNELMDAITAPAMDGAIWGTCVTAAAGAGKSSLFGHLHRRLREADVLVLAHAAGISVRSTQVDWMLRRWVGDLALAVGESDPLTEQATPDEIDQTFSRLLHQAAQSRRVVVLIDALNQFEPTTRGTHLTWMPRLWPANARLVATAIPGTHSQALLQRPGTTAKPLAAIGPDEALAIVRRICARYHRTLNARVEGALQAKRTTAGEPSFGNPLWLEIATEELNLLDAQAFEREESASTGTSGAERTVGLLLATVEQMPGEIEDLYGFMLDRAERQLGRSWTQAFVNAIGASRAGWRESDLEALLPVLSGEAWDPLRFATLRRGFRAHLVQRGAHAQWDFAHGQLRHAVFQRWSKDPGDVAALHRDISTHLLGLPPEDPLHQTETMVHLVLADAALPAATFFGAALSNGQLDGATKALASVIAHAAAPGGRAHHLAFVMSLVSQMLDVQTRVRISDRFANELNAALKDLVSLDIRGSLLLAAQRVLEGLAPNHPEDLSLAISRLACWTALADVMTASGQVDKALGALRAGLAVFEGLVAAGKLSSLIEFVPLVLMALDRSGNAWFSQGRLQAALDAYRSSLKLRLELAQAIPANDEVQEGQCVSRLCIGDVLKDQGNLVEAMVEYRTALRVVEDLARRAPTNAQWSKHLITVRIKIGDVLTADGNSSEALPEYRQSLGMAERLVAEDPGDVGRLRDLGLAQRRVAHAVAALGDVGTALELYQASARIAEQLVARDRLNATWRSDLWSCRLALGDLFRTAGDASAAVAAYQQSLAAAEQLEGAIEDPASLEAAAVAHTRIGDVFSAQNLLPAALDEYQASLAAYTRLKARFPAHARFRCQRGLTVTYTRIGEVSAAQGDLSSAQEAYRASLENLADAPADCRDERWRRDVEAGNLLIGRALHEQGSLHDAIAAFRVALAMAEQARATDSASLTWQQNVGAINKELGVCLEKAGRQPEALTAYRASLAVAAPLAAMNVTDIEQQRTVAVLHVKIADLLRDNADWREAAAAYQASIPSLERIAAADAGNSAWQRVLLNSYDQVGDASRALKDWPNALTAYRTSLSIVERLAAIHHGDLDWQRDVAVRQDRIGGVLMAQGDLPGALLAYQASLRIRKGLAAEAPKDTALQRALSVSLDQLGHLRTARGEFGDALELFKESLSIRQRLSQFDSSDAGLLRDLVIGFHDTTMAAMRVNDPGAIEYWQGCYDALQRMIASAMPLDPALVDLLGRFKMRS